MTRFVSFSRLVLVAAVLSALGAGCFGGTTGPTGPDGGIWKTTDKGATWTNLKALVTDAKVTGDVSTYAINDVVLDPQDHNTLYAATQGHGLLVSLDGGVSWTQPRVLTTGTVNSIAVDPKDKCTVYVGIANKIYETTDCTRDWNQVFYDPRTDNVFTQLVIDWYNPMNVFAGSSDGDIFRSTDGGTSWSVSDRVDGTAINSLVMDSKDSRTLYAGTQGSGILKTSDGGATWTQISKQFGDQYGDAKRTIRVVLDPSTPGTVYDISKYGIIKSTDGGNTWNALNLTQPPESIKITSLAIDPTNDANIAFAGVQTLQFSIDSGATWTPKKLPTTQAASQLIIDPANPSTMYLATEPPPSK